MYPIYTTTTILPPHGTEAARRQLISAKLPRARSLTDSLSHLPLSPPRPSNQLTNVSSYVRLQGYFHHIHSVDIVRLLCIIDRRWQLALYLPRLSPLPSW